MLRTLLPLAAAAAFAATGVAAQPQSQAPTPGEQASIHQGDAGTNGSSTIVRDATGAHMDGYPHMAIGQDSTGRPGPVRRHHHHRHHARVDAQ